jgi:aminopeptidase N
MTWKYKHPSPYDFFNYMDNLIGEDLSWFWEPWYFEFSNPDLEIQKGNIDNEILVLNKGGIPLPITLTLTYNDEKQKVIERSIWSWSAKNKEVAIFIPDIDDIISITLGSPSIPDVNKANNTLVLQNNMIGEL